MRHCLVTLALVCSAFVAVNAQSGLGIRKLTCPHYPELARHAKIAGDVHLRVFIQTDGTVRTARILNGPKLLADSAAKNVMSWQYTDQAKEHEIDVTYRYRLESARTREREMSDVNLQSATLIEIVSRPPSTIEEKVNIPKPGVPESRP